MTGEVDFISGRTRLYAILGDPIDQVRSPEMMTTEFHRRGMDALMLPVHAQPADFETVMTGLKAIVNLDGFVLTIPFKNTAIDHADVLGPQARRVGAINVLARLPDGRWCGEIFDGIGCLKALNAAGHDLRGKRIQLIGAGGAGSAIGIALADMRPALMRIVDPDGARARKLMQAIRRIDPSIAVEAGPARASGLDFILNASPVGMLDDGRNPLGTAVIPSETVVFDAIVKPAETPLLRAARACGCRIVEGRQMMHGQIGQIVDFVLAPETLS